LGFKYQHGFVGHKRSPYSGRQTAR